MPNRRYFPMAMKPASLCCYTMLGTDGKPFRWAFHRCTACRATPTWQATALKKHLHSTNFDGNEAPCGHAGLVAPLSRPCASHSRWSLISARLVGTPTAPQPAFAPSALHGNVAWCEGVPASQRRFRPGKPRNYLGYRRCQAGDAVEGL